MEEKSYRFKPSPIVSDFAFILIVCIYIYNTTELKHRFVTAVSLGVHATDVALDLVEQPSSRHYYLSTGIVLHFRL